MMEEVLTEALLKLIKNDNTLQPDVIIIDGGRGQYNSVKKFLKKYKLNNIKLIKCF